ncbi:MAG TPA: hypothetical protein EYO90_04740, partial [Candidatus Latescibacteria bacterium]|nr:hypothetical protein [Candidatus Latescibacterota bacterium]
MCPSSWRTSWLGGVSASLRVSSSRRCHTRPHCYRLCRTRSRFPAHRSAPSGPRSSAARSSAFSKRTPSILTARRSAGHQPVGSPLPLLAHPRKHHPPFGTYPPGTGPIADELFASSQDRSGPSAYRTVLTEDDEPRLSIQITESATYMSIHRNASLQTVIALALLGAVLAARGEPMTRQSAIALALRNNPEVKAARAEWDAARARARAAWAPPDPEFEVEFEGLKRLSDPGGFAERSIGVVQTIEFPLKWWLNHKAADREAKATRASTYDLTRLDVATR